MRRVTLRSLWAHKRRLLATVVTIIVGVAFMSGTFILATTLDRAFDDLFAEAVEQVDALVQGEVVFTDERTGDQRGNVPAALVDALNAVDGVRVAEPRVSTAGGTSNYRLIRADGEAVGPPRANTTLESWIEDADLSPYELDEGRAPERAGEVALNVAALEDADLEVGDSVTVVGQGGPEVFRIIGSLTFGTARSAGGAITATFTLTEAQRLAGLTDEVHSIYVAATDGVTEDELVARLAPEVPDGLEALTGTAATEQLSDDSQSDAGVGFIGTLLAIFSVIALIIGTFVISNTFSILVAQRTRELALLRALGASRVQVLGSVLLEAAVIGLLSAVLGLGAGVLLSRGIAALLTARGLSLPSGPLVVQLDTIVLSLLTGVVVTMLAALVPALRATRVPPLAALRDVSVDRSDLSRVRIGVGIVGLAVAAFNLSAAWRYDNDTSSIPIVGLGAGLGVVGFLGVGPVLAGRSVRALGRPLPRHRGVIGRLATENAARSPRRTSATASAIVIGVALVVLITIFAASATKSVTTEVDRVFDADFAVGPERQGLQFSGGMPLTIADTVRSVDGVELVSMIGLVGVELGYPDGDVATHFATAVEQETFPAIYAPRMLEGAVDTLSEDGIILNEGIVRDHGIELGDTITVTTSGGGQARFEVEGVSDDVNLLSLVTLSRERLRALEPRLVDVQVAGRLEPGADLATVMADVTTLVADVPNLEVLDRDGVTGSIADQITSALSLVYGLLFLSIVTALLGIANTLSLSITERVRELGLLRAIGMDRAGVRAAVRWEAALIAALGACIGLLMGIVLGYALLQALTGLGLATKAFPAGALIAIVLATTALGTLASVRPARRAASLSVLDAIATE